MKEKRLSELFSLYLQRTSSESEVAELMLLLVDPELRTERERLLEEWMDRSLEGEGMTKEMADRIRRNILEIEPGRIPEIERDQILENDKVRPVVRTLKPLRRLWWAAAVIFLSLGIYFLVENHKKQVVPAPVAEISNDLKPGSYKAMLKLGDGSMIILNSVENGQIARQGNTVVNKINNEEIAYVPSNEKPTVEYNTLTTPMGGEYRIVLPDGSRVWLNAASSIYFPSVFTGKQRNVTISGEAYFEVAHNAVVPFVVSILPAANCPLPTQITVLGTHFNINSYADESSRQITLLEGSVKVQDGGSELKLVPGQQADIGEDQKMILRKGVDTDGIVAWKNGEFYFQKTDIQTIMRQISRWYNVEVIFEGKISKKKFDGVMSRNSSLKDVLKILEVAGIKFRIEGKKIYVSS